MFKNSPIYYCDFFFLLLPKYDKTERKPEKASMFFKLLNATKRIYQIHSVFLRLLLYKNQNQCTTFIRMKTSFSSFLFHFSTISSFSSTKTCDVPHTNTQQQQYNSFVCLIPFRIHLLCNVILLS